MIWFYVGNYSTANWTLWIKIERCAPMFHRVHHNKFGHSCPFECFSKQTNIALFTQFTAPFAPWYFTQYSSHRFNCAYIGSIIDVYCCTIGKSLDLLFRMNWQSTRILETITSEASLIKYGKQPLLSLMWLDTPWHETIELDKPLHDTSWEPYTPFTLYCILVLEEVDIPISGIVFVCARPIKDDFTL